MYLKHSHSLGYGICTPEFRLDMVVFGKLMAGCVPGSFVAVIFGFGDGNLHVGSNCGNAYSSACLPATTSCATAYMPNTWLFLLL